MTKYALVDAANLFYRARHVVRGDAFTKAGMALHIVFRSLRKLYREQNCDHVVLCLEGKSWRFDVYPEYKARRKLDRLNMKPQEKEEDEVFLATLEDFAQYMAEKTRCTVLQSQGVEGDDFIARWIQLHPNDEHVILSGDSDFIQLLADNVSIYNGVDNRLITHEGVFDGDSGKALMFSVDTSSGKLKVPGITVDDAKKKHDKEQKEKEKAHLAREKDRKPYFEQEEKNKNLSDPTYEIKPFVAEPYRWVEFDSGVEPKWWQKALFIKCIRGDTGDGIFSAYPGVRYEGSKGKNAKPSIREAWEDRNDKGFNYNNFMLQSWDKLKGVDADGNNITEKVRVIDEFKFNESLIDLTAQPQHVKDLMDSVIVQAVQKEPVGNVGVHFLQFCHRNQLNNLAREATDHATYLNSGYK